MNTTIVDVIRKCFFTVHHSRAVFPSNDGARDVDKRGGGVGGGRSVDISAASDSQHKNCAADMITYRTHGIHSRDIKNLSAQTTAACTLQEVGRETMSAQRPSSHGADQDNANLRSDMIPVKTERCKGQKCNKIICRKLSLWVPANGKS